MQFKSIVVLLQTLNYLIYMVFLPNSSTVSKFCSGKIIIIMISTTEGPKNWIKSQKNAGNQKLKTSTPDTNCKSLALLTRSFTHKRTKNAEMKAILNPMLKPY